MPRLRRRNPQKRFARADIDVIINARVSAIEPDKVKLTIKDPKDKNAEPKAVEVPAGFVLWSTGIGGWRRMCWGGNGWLTWVATSDEPLHAETGRVTAQPVP